MRAICPMARHRKPASTPRRVALGMLVGVTMIAGAQVPAFGQRADQTAMSVPRPALQAGVAGLPQPLAPSEAARLRRIFDLLARGDAATALREVERLEDRRLVGHVQAAAWLRRGAEPGPEALAAWLADHADHPDAPAIWEALQRRSPGFANLSPPPRQESLSEDNDEIPEERDGAARLVNRNPQLDRAVRERARDGDVAGAIRLINPRLGATYATLLRADVAQILFQQGQDEAAFRLASATAQAAPNVGFPAYIAGLAAWSMDQPEQALAWFERAARADIASPAMRSAAAFWTARAAVRARRPQLYVPWMTQAAQEPRTFYGLIARRALGLPLGIAWTREVPGDEDAAVLAETASGWRALALIQVGQMERAEVELRALWPRIQGNPGAARAMLLVASQAGMTDLAAQVATLSQGADGRPRDFARFPLPRLEPRGGFRVAPSLIYGLAPQESNFDPRAVSSAGARGMMQIMPATASYVMGDPGLARSGGVGRLHDTAFSVEVGQRYLEYLARHEAVGGDLLRVLAAYNNGPGNMSRWQASVRHRDDPFLFIEGIPVVETRLFVQRVLAYSWIYAGRLNLPAPSLDALAAGRFPRFQAGAEARDTAPRRQMAER